MSDTPFVYFIKPIGADGPVKIGCSKTPKHRLTTLMCWSPVPLEIVATVPGDYALERNVHECFADLHSHREWFRHSPRLETLIRDLRSGVRLEDALDLSARVGKIVSKARKARYTPEHRRFLSYTQRVWRTADRLRTKEGYYAEPGDFRRIMHGWSHRADGDKSYLPPAADLAYLDQVLAAPETHFVFHAFHPFKAAA